MLPRFADPKTDFVFKRIFGDVAHKHILVAFLNDLLELEGDQRITDVVHLTPEQRVAVPELKLSIVDVKCKDALGRRFVVEMQVLNVEGFEKRVVYNVAKAYTLQLRSAEGYAGLTDVVGVTICDFELWPKQAERQPAIPMHSRWRLREEHTGAAELGQLKFVFLELPKYSAGDQPIAMVDKWAFFFREAENLEVVPGPLMGSPVAEALEIARVAGFSPEEWDAYDRAKMAEQDARGSIAVALREGHDKGLREGLDKGLREGLRRGTLQAIRDLCDILDVRLDETAHGRLAAADDTELQTIRDTLKRERRFPA